MKYTYTQSQLVTSKFLGCELDDKYYRVNNIQKLNHILCFAYSKQYTVQIFEVLDSPSELQGELYQLKLYESYYAKLEFDGKSLVAIFTPKGKDFSIGVVDAVSDDYSLLCSYDLSDDSVDIEEVAFNVYQLAQHFLHKQKRKDKGFTGSDLSQEMKKEKLVLVKLAKILQTS